MSDSHHHLHHPHVDHTSTHGSVDPDVDLHDPQQRDELHHHHPKILGAIALGGVIGAEARYGLALALPHDPGDWPWATLLTNLLGSLLIGALMAALARAGRGGQADQVLAMRSGLRRSPLVDRAYCAEPSCCSALPSIR